MTAPHRLAGSRCLFTTLMALPIGFLLMLLGAVAYYAWLPYTFHFLQGLIAFSLLFWGGIAMMVGISERKALRECEAALRDDENGDSATSSGRGSNSLGTPAVSGTSTPNEIGASEAAPAA